jgi:tetratricopeptide (TPR) repeat protein
VRTPRWLLLVGMALVPVLGSVTVARTAQAEPAKTTARPAPTPRGRALELFEQSAKAYREGRFQEAIDLLQEARRVRPEPVLLYDIGRAYEALGSSTQAADAYATYLLEEPSAPDRRAIEIRIETLRAHANELERARQAPAPPEAKPLPPEAPASAPPAAAPASDGLGAVPWVVAGVGVLGLGAGVALGLAAQSRHRSAVDEPSQAAAQREQDRAETLATGSTVALLAGAAIAAGGIAWLSVRLVTASPSATVAAGPGMLLVRGVF